MPRVFDDQVFVSSFYHGALMVQVTNAHSVRAWCGTGTAQAVLSLTMVFTR